MYFLYIFLFLYGIVSAKMTEQRCLLGTCIILFRFQDAVPEERESVQSIDEAACSNF
ncbi:hypothetical protein KC19_4G163200 [Ceratodon purpureus]|uniref:Uncharacterized protein n=1 Tax=Ceratodon purpureus TaxID=3225 RepID=A0A8T0IA55_CERPU|nr:hypothetical protein KC19_4G163200 [Ceratodon purpureus]